MKLRFSILLTLLALILASCNKKTSTDFVENSAQDTLITKYTTLFKICYFDNYKQVIIKNKWNNNVSIYYLVKDTKTKTPNDGITIKIPLTDIATTSCTQIGFLNELDELNCIKSTTSPELIYNEKVRKLIQQKKITNIGDAFNINIEKLVLQNPQAVFLNDFNEENPNAIKINKFKIPIIYINEWQENTPLGRAEWIKLFALFFDKEDVADSIFNEIEENYLSTKTTISSKKTSILSGICFQEIWNIPGGKSYMAMFFNDAGFSYKYKDNNSTESLSMNLEGIFTEFHDADVWIGCPSKTLKELIDSDERYIFLNCVKNKKVYNFKNRETETGGNDYWETGVVRPDLVLKDFVRIADDKSDSLYFMEKLK